MKKIVILMAVLTLLLGLFTFNALAQENVSVYIDGEIIEFDVPAQIIDSRTMVPLRGICEALGLYVDFENEVRKITIADNTTVFNSTFHMVNFLGNKSFGIVEDNIFRSVQSDVPTMTINDRTLVPVRVISESLGCDVEWEQATRSVLISTNEADFAPEKTQDDTNIGAEASNPLLGKKVSFLGDSICAGSKERGTLGGYGKIIADRNNMSYQNLGKGGATITAETYSSSTGYAKGWLCRMVENMDADADYAIIQGGINDAWQWSDHGTIEIGEITEGYDAKLDETTYYGAFESMLKQLVTKFQGKKIGYIATPKIMSLYDSEQNAPNFYHIALECCAKWGVPVCDLNIITPSASYLKTLGISYTSDGTHPTYAGYLKYYCDPIEAWMRKLTTVGGITETNAVEK